jgi:hypothetical protein
MPNLRSTESKFLQGTVASLNPSFDQAFSVRIDMPFFDEEVTELHVTMASVAEQNEYEQQGESIS